MSRIYPLLILIFLSYSCKEVKLPPIQESKKDIEIINATVTSGEISNKNTNISLFASPNESNPVTVRITYKENGREKSKNVIFNIKRTSANSDNFLIFPVSDYLYDMDLNKTHITKIQSLIANSMNNKMKKKVKNRITNDIFNAIMTSDFLAKGKKPDYDIDLNSIDVIEDKEEKVSMDIVFQHNVMEYNTQIDFLKSNTSLKVLDINVISTILKPVGKWYDFSGEFERTFEISDDGNFSIMEKNSTNSENINLVGTWKYSPKLNTLVFHFEQLNKEFEATIETKTPQKDKEDRFYFFNLQGMTFINI
ncbi:MAG: hypothetical protein JEY94_00990 [Melioribacteraceae bacterium]|nr:hypothetical protein [Melioribacteraceae bacterium]